MSSRTRKLCYPANWKELAKAAKEKAGYCCEWCGVAQGAMRTSLKGKPYAVVLTVHHPNGDTENPDAVLVALCQVCHLRDDARLHAEHAKETHWRKHRESLVTAGQLVLID